MIAPFVPALPAPKGGDNVSGNRFSPGAIKNEAGSCTMNKPSMRKSPSRDLNTGPADYKSAALPTKPLRRHMILSVDRKKGGAPSYF
jgi:hypothetical protein